MTSPLASKRLTRDVVEIAGPMHGRARRRLGDDQELGPPRVRLHLRRQRGEARRDVLARRLRAGCRGSSRARSAARPAPSTRDEVVAAVAEEREVVVGEPAQERLAFGELVRRQRRRRAPRSRRRSRATLSRIVFQSSTAARTSSSTRTMSAASASSCAGVDDAVDLDVDERFARARLRVVGARAPSSVPSASRSTATIGWMIRCSVRPWRLTSIVTESTRNGMSSLTISMIVCVDCQPCSSIDRIEDAHARRAPARACARNSSATARRRRDRPAPARRGPRDRPGRSSAGRRLRSCRAARPEPSPAPASAPPRGAARGRIRRLLSRGPPRRDHAPSAA